MTAENRCELCGQPVADQAYACSHCTGQRARALAEIIEFTPDARAVAAGQVRRGAGGAGGKPGSRSPGNDGAIDTVNEVQNLLTTLARDVAETRGPQSAPAPSASRFVPDPLVVAATWLSGQLEWLRHAVDGTEPYAIRAFGEIDWCAGRLRSTVNGPSEKRYLGPCGAPEWVENLGGEAGCRELEGPPCDGDVYVRGAASLGRCETCGTTVPRAARKEWLDEQVGSSDLVWTAIGIAHALGLNVKTIRSWAVERRAPNGVVLRRAKLATYWHNGEQLVPWVDPLPGQNVRARGDRLHYVADVVRLAAEAAQRRTEEQQTTEEDAA